MNVKTEHIVSLGQIELNETEVKSEELKEYYPVLPTRDFVLFPGITYPISLGRESSINTAERAEKDGSLIVIACQKNANEEYPSIPDDIYRYGVLGRVVKIFDIPGGPKTAIIHAFNRVRILGAGAEPLTVVAEIDKELAPQSEEEQKRFRTLARSVKQMCIRLLKEGRDEPNELSFNLDSITDPMTIINIVATHAPLMPGQKIELLSEPTILSRSSKLLDALATNAELMNIMSQVQERAQRNMSEGQRNAFLQNQMEAIRQELYGDEDDSDKFRSKASQIDFPENIRPAVEREIDKLARLNPQSPDYSVQYTYLDLLLSLPWNEFDDLNSSLPAAEDILNHDHYGLEKVKERILEQLAVMMNNPEGKSPIICLVGAPGVGKTSLGQSIARSLGRRYQRVSLGGLHDESEIRGHRRTYIGAMPGRIIDAMKRAGSSNPVLLLDEIDKIGTDIKSDPAAALLEVLDPEQNCRFHDNYLDVDYDLSKVMFIATANTLSTLSQPLLDRMEIIELSGYLQEEKIEIAKRHLLPRILASNAMKERQLVFTDEAIAKIIENYTSESGVRQLEKRLASIVRKVILKKMRGERVPRIIKETHLRNYLGPEMRTRDTYEGNSYAGVVTGLAWTAVGGEILYVESSLAKGKGEKITLTGNLGEVMKESAVIALQYVKAHADRLGVDPELFERYTLHIHVPEGAIPKDGPSAGITVATSIVSAVTQRKVRDRIAMTGEITLRGKVLPVGGIKEKILAAKRAGISTIILSEENRKDIEDIAQKYIEGLRFVYVRDVSEVIDFALLDEKVDNPVVFD